MPGFSPITFSGVTDEVWACLKARAKGIGVTLPGDAGSVSKQGITVEYRRDPRAEMLTIAITQLPPWIDCATAAARVREAAAGCGAR